MSRTAGQEQSQHWDWGLQIPRPPFSHHNVLGLTKGGHIGSAGRTWGVSQAGLKSQLRHFLAV